MLAREHFSLVLLDLNMPYVTGHDILVQSAALENRPPIVLVTGSSEINDFADGTAGGAIDYLLKPFDREQLRGVVHRALAHPSDDYKGRLTRNYLLSGYTTSGEQLRSSAATGSIIDILEHTKQEYRRLIGSLPTPYVLLEEDTYRIRYCNDAFRRFLGSKSAAPAQMCFFDLIDDKQRAKTIQRLLQEGELQDEELRGRSPGGRCFVIVGSFRLLPSDGFVEGGFVDVTGPRQLELQLVQAHKLETVGRLAAGLAHDFKNTLQVVSGFTELISLEVGATQQVQAHAKEIRLATEKASKMVCQLLSMGSAPLKANTCVELNSQLREAESSLRQHLRAGQSLVLSLHAGNPLVDISAFQLDQLVRNLVLNARDALAMGGTITITTKIVSDPSQSWGAKSVILEIKDTGTGMDAETAAKIFEPFFTTKPAGEGTGLGLSMVQMIVQAAGGRIHVESSLGKGTLFRIMFPLATPEPHGKSLLPEIKTKGTVDMALQQQ